MNEWFFSKLHNKWVGQLSYLLICVTRTWWKSLNMCWISSITLAIIAAASVDPFKALKRVFESHSNSTSQTPTFHAKVIPSPLPLPCSLKVQMGTVISYLKSLLHGLHGPELPPNPVDWSTLKVAPSTFSFYHGGTGFMIFFFFRRKNSVI